MKYDYSETIDYLLDWYDLNKRILPWRDQKNPYYTWVSEIMLQQTRVEAVKFYFERFIKELPDIESLANANEEKLLKLWEGLGYYNRVRNMQKAAIVIMAEYDGAMPANYEDLLSLAGIGSYTAGAIASIAYNLPVAAVDGNVLRVMKRVADSFDDISKQSVKRELEADLKEIMNIDRPGDYNQSIMELGATVCIPNGRPLCETCPIMHLCKGYKNGHERMLPVKASKKARRIEERTIIIFAYNGKYTIRKRPSKGLLAGLWELPNIDKQYTSLNLYEELVQQGLEDFDIKPLGESKHIFSHIEWHMTGFLIILQELSQDSLLKDDSLETSSGEPKTPNIDLNKDILHSSIWASKLEIEERYTLPTAFSYYKDYLK